MRIQSSSNRPKAQPRNLTIQVTGFVTENDRTGKPVDYVEGINLDTNQPVKVTLSTQGIEAENAARKSIKDYRDGFRMGRNEYKMEAGGIMSFRTAFPNKDGTQFLAVWPNALAYNAKDAAEVVRIGRPCSLQVFVRKVTQGEGEAASLSREANAILTEWHHDKAFVVKSAQDLIQAGEHVAAAQAAKLRPGFLLRAVEDNTVVGYGVANRSYDREQKRELTRDEMVAQVAEVAQQVLQDHPNATLEVIPNQVLTVSPLQLKDGGDKAITKLEAQAKAYLVRLANGDQDLVMKTTDYQVGFAPNQHFVNAVMTRDPYGPGVDPVLAPTVAHPDLGYSAELAADMTPAPRAAASAPAAAESQAHAEAEIPMAAFDDDEFAGIDDALDAAMDQFDNEAQRARGPGM